MLNPQLLEILVCPITKAPLFYKPERNELWCRQSELAYPIVDDIPMMVEDGARSLTAEELRSLERG